MQFDSRTNAVLSGLVVAFGSLAAAFLLDLWGKPLALPAIPEVDPQFTNTATARLSYRELERRGEDLSDFECYICHEKDKPPPLRFDQNNNLIIPEEHENIVLGHGRHQRNNNCFNCHDETNLERFQTRDGRPLKFSESTPLCGSCHGPTYRDWEAGVHGRTNGHWDRSLGSHERQDCVACHNPHSPKFPTWKPAPGPNPLHAVIKPAKDQERSH